MINSALLDDIRLIGYDAKISQDGHITVQGTSDYGADFFILEDEEAYWVFENWGGTNYECIDGFGDIDKALNFAKRLELS